MHVLLDTSYEPYHSYIHVRVQLESVSGDCLVLGLIKSI